VARTDSGVPLGPEHLRGICRTTFCPSLQLFLFAQIGETCSFLVSDPASRSKHYLLAVQKASNCYLRFSGKNPNLRRIRYHRRCGRSVEN
jgi:hypothetical protein